ncbi:MAG: EAL domain-containing protein [Pseudomonadota bacterium]
MESLIKKVIDSKDEMELYQRCLNEVYLRYKPDHCLIAEYNLEQRTATTRCYLAQGKLADNISYSLGGTPCEAVLDSADMCVYSDGIQAQFPEDDILQVIDAQSYVGIPIQSRSKTTIGVIALMYNHALPDVNFDNNWFETLGFLIGKTILQQRLGKQKDDLLSQFQRSEQLTHSGSWSWNIAENHFTYSSHLAQMLSAPHKTSLSFDQFFSRYVFKQPEQFVKFKANLNLSSQTEHFTVYKEHNPCQLQLEINYSRQFDQQGNLAEVTGHVKNVTHVSDLEAEFDLAQTVIDLSPHGVIVTDKNNRIIKCNSKVENISGFSAEELEGRNPSILASNAQDEDFYRCMWQAVHENGFWSGEIWNQSKSGAIYPEHLSIYQLRNRLGEIQNYIGIFEDLSLQKSIENELNRYKEQSDFTGLMKREKFINALETVSKPVVIIVDIKRFSSFNNIYGESFGNKLLIYVGQLIHDHFCSESINICRYGADQFALSVDKSASVNIGDLVTRIRSVIETPFKIDTHAIELAVNIGVSSINDVIDTHPLNQAYYALIEAKNAPLTATIEYSVPLEHKIARRHDLSRKLKKAIDEKRIDVAYQTIYDLDTNSIVEMEALARWSEDNEVIPPFEFISIAEEFGYIFQLGQVLLEKVCQDIIKLKQLGFDKIPVNVNRSIDELSQESHSHCSITEIIDKYGLSYKDIVVEVTESIPLEDKPQVQELLRILRKQGVKVALDDFGTGYASFSNLMKNTVDILKIDRSFVMDIEKNRNNVVLIQSVTLLAEQLGVSVIAEGVETQGQLDILRGLNCRYIQGYLLSKPKSIDAVIGELKNSIKAQQAIT